MDFRLIPALFFLFLNGAAAEKVVVGFEIIHEKSGNEGSDFFAARAELLRKEDFGDVIEIRLLARKRGDDERVEVCAFENFSCDFDEATFREVCGNGTEFWIEKKRNSEDEAEKADVKVDTGDHDSPYLECENWGNCENWQKVEVFLGEAEIRESESQTFLDWTIRENEEAGNCLRRRRRLDRFEVKYWEEGSFGPLSSAAVSNNDDSFGGGDDVSGNSVRLEKVADCKNYSFVVSAVAEGGIVLDSQEGSFKTKCWNDESDETVAGNGGSARNSKILPKEIQISNVLRLNRPKRKGRNDGEEVKSGTENCHNKDSIFSMTLLVLLTTSLLGW